MYLAWDLEYMRTNGMGYLVSKETAESLLHLLEPTQVAYGAIILSFLGAIHWGLEFAKFGGSHPYRRYTLGILAPALAWPTVLLPLDYALVVQFVGFTGIYFADAQATMLGWAPKWYTTYRFILTFIVGVCIVTTLIGRGKVYQSALCWVEETDLVLDRRRRHTCTAGSRSSRRPPLPPASPARKVRS